MTNNVSAGAYVPGVCNINTAEIARRRQGFYSMLVITLVLAAAVFFIDLPSLARLVLLFPIYLTAVCYFQVKYKFCVGYGAAGLQNATEGDKEAQAIVDAAAKKLDQQRTRKIKLQALAIGAVISLLLVVLPV